MEDKNNLVKEVDIIFIAKKIRILGIAILFGMILIYSAGLMLPGSYVNEELAIFNILSFIICCLFCIPSVFMKKFFLNNLNAKNFRNKYFNAHMVSFAMCDMGGLFCLVTNLFVNLNVIYATAGIIIAVFFVIINFPKSDDYLKVKGL